jgi:hypothetical protein
MNKFKFLEEMQDFNMEELKKVLSAVHNLMAKKQDRLYRLRVRMFEARKDLHPACKQ